MLNALKKINSAKKLFSHFFLLMSYLCFMSTAFSHNESGNKSTLPKTDIFRVVEKIKLNNTFNNLNRCPIDYAPEQERAFPKNAASFYQNCIADISVCYKRCTQNQPYACYYLAQTLQGNGAVYEAEQLFQRSCELGVASGCTNRAAGIKNMKMSNTAIQQSCLTRTFEKSCKWKDPWGCTMYAYQLADGSGGARDHKKALKVLQGSCIYGKDDPACEAAQQLKSYLKDQSKP